MKFILVLIGFLMSLPYANATDTARLPARVLRVAMTGDYYPYTFCGDWKQIPIWSACQTGPRSPDKGNVKGIDVDTARYLADQLGYKLQIVLVSNADIFNKLKKGEFDLSMSAWGYSRSRLEYGYFTDPYSADQDSTDIRLIGASSLGMLNLDQMNGIKVGVVSNTLHDDYATRNFAPQGAIIDRYPDGASALDAVLAGSDDVNLTDSFGMQGWFGQHPGFGIVSKNIQYTQDGVNQGRALIMVHDPDLIGPINLALHELEANGGMRVIWNKYPMN
jgi:polar amino acid transport system substrate-binding protein